MLNLIAAAYEDGYAFVKEGKRVYALRPPYRQQNKTAVSLLAVERAVTTHGFAAESLTFDDWGALIEHLKNRLIESRKERGISEPNTAQIRRLVERAPRNIIEQYLG